MNVREDLKAFVDEELSAARRAEVEEALKADEALRGEMEFLRLMGAEIRESAIQPEIVGLEKTLNYLDSAEKKPQLTKFPTWQVILAAASCLMIAAILFPNFAQSKAAAKKTTQASLQKQRELEAEMAKAEGGETLYAKSSGPSAGKMPARAPSEDRDYSNGSGGGMKTSTLPAAEQPGDGTISIRQRGGADVTNTHVAMPPGPNGLPLQRPLMIRTGELSLEVEDVQKSERQATHLVEAMQGIVQSTNRTAVDGQPGAADMVLRVPERKFMAAMEALGNLGKIKTQSSNGEDVTAQVADVEARLKVMRTEEGQYIDILRKAHRIEDILSVKERLSQVRQEVESLDAQRKALRSQSSYSTITLSMAEKPKAEKPKEVSENWLDNTLTSAKDMLSGIGRFLAQTGIYLGFLSPLWVPLLVVGLWYRKRSMR